MGKDSEVTLVMRGPEVGQRGKYWVRPDIINRIEEGSIKALYKAEVKEIKEGSLIVSTNEGDIEIENDFGAWRLFLPYSLG